MSLNYRLRSANRDDCISMMVRGDADALLCYETEDETPLPLDQSFRRTEWAQDRMIPVVGGQLRYTILDKHKLPPDVPVVTYPDTSYLGQTLLRKCPDWAAAQRTMRPICERRLFGRCQRDGSARDRHCLVADEHGLAGPRSRTHHRPQQYIGKLRIDDLFIHKNRPSFNSTHPSSG